MCEFRTDRPDEWSIEVEAGRLAYTIYAGPTPLDALRRFTEVHGRQPAPERWFFGPWYQSGPANHVPPGEEHRQLDALGGTAVSVV
jgi:alpha-glucosidase (family GH31 glycosyl hydrolase)